jgi:hypothetical protein
VRVHRVRTGRPLRTAEGGFAVDRDTPPARTAEEPGRAAVASAAGLCVVQDLDGARTGRLVVPMPGTNVAARRTVLPTLTAELPPGEHWLTCAVLGQGPDVFNSRTDEAGWPTPPAPPARDALPRQGSKEPQ